MDTPGRKLTPRLAAARVLVALERGRTTLGHEVEFDRSGLPDARDRGLLLEIVTGVLRWQAALDACVAARSTRPVADLTPEVRAVLRSGAYQLLYLDRLPAHAVVHESVEVIRQLKQARAAGFVNAVLRGLLRAGDARASLPPKPLRLDDANAALDYLSITLSHPRWLVTRWLDRFGFEATARWCEFNNASPAVTIRPLPGDTASALRDRLAEAGVAARPSPFAPNSLRVSPGSLGRLEEAARQSLVIQDEGSQLVAVATDAAPGLTVLDVCASPGGKTALLREVVGASGIVIAGDLRPARVRLLKKRLQAMGAPTPVLALDAAAALPFRDAFDRVLLDAPCSGLGTLRRDPDLKWTRTAEDLKPLADSQARMLEVAAAVVRPGGVLTYATCSSEPEENEEVVERFLAAASGFRRDAVRLTGAHDSAAGLIDQHGYLHTYPFRDDLDAFFAARLVRSRTA